MLFAAQSAVATWFILNDDDNFVWLHGVVRVDLDTDRSGLHWPRETSSISVPGVTVDRQGKTTEIVTTGRHDPCVGLRATPIAEAMIALVLMDHYLRHRAQNADVESDTPVITKKAK